MSITKVLTFTKDSQAKLIDARGPRFGAIMTTALLTVVIATESLALLLIQLTIFALGAFLGPHASPYAWIYKKVIKPRLRGDIPTEDIRLPQFAQLVGFLFTVAATTAFLTGATTLAMIITGFALAAALLNAAFNICLGCEMYLLLTRLRSALSSRSNPEESYRLPNL
jgi:hypothetical protein